MTATAIVIKGDGTVDPFGLYWLRESKFSLLAGTKGGLEEVAGMDGAIDFGTEFSADEIILELISGELTQVEKIALRNTVVGQLNQLREYGTLAYESDPAKVMAVRLNGKPSQQDIPGRFRISIPLLCQPLWYGDTEYSLTGSGTATNLGTFETPVIVEVRGPCTNPSVSVNGITMTYTGLLGSGDIIIIDTGALTATLNGVGALTFNGAFPTLLPGDNTVVAATGGTTIFKWRDCWL